MINELMIILEFDFYTNISGYMWIVDYDFGLCLKVSLYMDMILKLPFIFRQTNINFVKDAMFHIMFNLRHRRRD